MDSSTGLGQVQLKCDRKSVSRAILLLRSYSVFLWPSAPPTWCCTKPSLSLLQPPPPCFLPLLAKNRAVKESSSKSSLAPCPDPGKQLCSVKILSCASSKLCSALPPWQHKHPSPTWGQPPPQTGLPVSPRLLPAESAAGDGLIKQA